MDSSRPRRCALITCPRTASNLLVRILNLQNQSAVAPPPLLGGYYFLPAFLKSCELQLRQKHMEDWTEEERSEILQTYQTGFDALQKYVNSAEESGKISFIKEHATMMFGPTSVCEVVHPGSKVTEEPWLLVSSNAQDEKPARSELNRTLLPDEFLNTLLPTFLIRHPALAFPSFQRQMAKIKNLPSEDSVAAERKSQMTLKWSRWLYDYYSDLFKESQPEANGGPVWPLVLEADDIIKHPEVVMGFCDLAGLDKTKLLFSWEKASEEQLQNMTGDTQTMLGTLNNSNGIMKDNVSTNIDIDAEGKKWRVEFGEEVGAEIEALVRAAMPDYEFLKSKRLTPAMATST